MAKLSLTTCREDAKISQGNWGFTAFGATAIKEHLSSTGRVMALGTQSEVTFRPGIIYKAYTGLKTGLQKLDIRASAEAWKSGSLEVLRVNIAIPEAKEGEKAPSTMSGELEVFFRVSAEFAFRRMTPLFEAWTPEGATVQAGERAPAAGVAFRTDGEKAIRPAHAPVAAPTPGNPGASEEAAAEQAAKDWLNSPDERGHVVATSDARSEVQVSAANVSGIQVPDAGDDQRVDDSAISSHDAAQTAGANESAAAIQAHQAAPQGTGYQQQELRDAPPAPAEVVPAVAVAPAPPAPPVVTEVASVDLSKAL